MPSTCTTRTTRRSTSRAPTSRRRADEVAVDRFLDIRAVDAAIFVWTAVWLLAGAYVYTSVKKLEGYGETTVTAAVGLNQTSTGLVRAAQGLRDTGDALDSIPFVGEQIDANIRRTARDVDTIATTVRKTARRARDSGADTRDAAQGVAAVLGAAVALVPTIPLVLLYLLLRPLVAQELRRR